MKISKNIIILLLVLMQFSCVEDPWEDIATGDWNNERSIIALKLKDQVGPANITRIDDASGAITVTVVVGAKPDFSAVTVTNMELSYGAESDVSVGEPLNFNNENDAATITITSPTGKSRVYTVTITPFEETILGTYNITDLVVYGGTGPEFGGAAVIPMMDKPWVWNANDGPSAELDNTLTFEYEGVTEEGYTHGKVINDAGPDGLYADFMFIGSPEQVDVNHFYRKIPKGEGTWLRNYDTGEITFTSPDGTTSVASLIGPGTEQFQDDRSKTTTNQAFVFNLNGTDDWVNNYTDYDKFAKRPRRFWIDVEKQ